MAAPGPFPVPTPKISIHPSPPQPYHPPSTPPALSPVLFKKRKWDDDPGGKTPSTPRFSAAGGDIKPSTTPRTPMAAQQAFRQSAAKLLSVDEITGIYRKYDPIKGIIAKVSEAPEKREAEKRALIEVLIKPYRALMLANSGLTTVTAPDDLARLETASWEEKKQMSQKSTPVFSASLINELLFEAKARVSPTNPHLMIEPHACVWGQACAGHVAKFNGFQKPGDPFATDKQKDMGYGMTFMAAMTASELTRFYATGEKPDLNDGFHSFCIVCLSGMTDVGVESRTSGESGFDHKICLQPFGVTVGGEGNYDSTSVIQPNDEKYNGLVYPMVRFVHDRVMVYRDPKTGLRRLDQSALLERPKGIGSATTTTTVQKPLSTSAVPPPPPTPASALIPYSNNASGTASSSSSSTSSPPVPIPAPSPSPSQPPPSIIPDPVERAVKNF